MTQIENSLRELALQGEREYAAVAAPEHYAAQYLSGVKAVRRRRQAAWGAVAVVVLALAVVVAPFLGRNSVEPIAPGQEVWRAQLGGESWASPAVAGEVVVAAANDGVVRGFDLEGQPLWTVETGRDVRAPITVGQSGIYAHSDDGHVYALTAQGEVRWDTPVEPEVLSRDVYVPYGSGAIEVDGVVVVGASDGGVVALDADTGDLLWRVQTLGAVTTTPAVSAELAAGEPGAARTVFVASQDGRLRALDLDTGEERWAQAMGMPIMSSPAAAEGVVVTGSRGSQVVGFDTVSGTPLWRVDMGGSWADSSVDIDEGTAYFGSSAAGDVVGADLHTGAEVWRSHVGGWPWARPTARGQTVYATAGRIDEHRPYESALYALDRETGTVAWRADGGTALEWGPTGSAFGAMTSPAVTERLVIVAGLDGVLRAIAR